MPPPGSFAMVGVVQQDYSNGLEQTVWLTTSSSVTGQNYLKVRYTGGISKAGRPSMDYSPITPQTLRREMIVAAPGVRLAANTNFLRNAYGPIGYASGRSSSGDTCLYGWQQIRSRAAPSGIGRDFGMIQVRARLCDHTASERDLLHVMYGYTVTGTFPGEIWNPYGSAEPVSPLMAYAGRQVLPPDPVVPATYAFGVNTSMERAIARQPAMAATTATVRTTSRKTPAAVKEPQRPEITIPLPDALTGSSTGTTGKADTKAGPAETQPFARPNAAQAPLPLVPMPDCLASEPGGTGCSARQ
ncbi:cellulose biosynthesis protein BcsN [Rhizobium sp. RU35A]|uniref:cellulose biosynthesis protein BcsN n=1 Tax=Rhizobium sp. RU35A TaxID=1907414 RepID=UPI00122C532E|nr:cellulose biosynthesis protein BcsN [Rhizobium sp. RU35A]